MQKEISEYSILTHRKKAEVRTAINGLKEKGLKLSWQERAEAIRALTEQKLYPAKPQLTAEELASQARRLSAERENNGQKRGSLFFYMRGLQRSDLEMQEVFHRAYSMKVSDALELASRAIELLGI